VVQGKLVTGAGHRKTRAEALARFGAEIRAVLDDSEFTPPERDALARALVSRVTAVLDGVGTSPLKANSRKTGQSESVKLSTGFEEARERGRAAPSDCRTQP
jgi:hypothetical protein